MKNRALFGIIVALAVAIAMVLGTYGVYVFVDKMNTVISNGWIGDIDLSGNYYPYDSVADGSGSGSSAGTESSEQGTDEAQTKPTAAELREAFDTKLDTMLKYMDYYYYDDIDREKMYDAMLHAAVTSLGDPYSVYYSPEEFDALMESASGIYSGIGATISQNMQTMVMTIVTPFAGSPANTSGILPGDEIIGVDREDVRGQDLNEVVAKIKGPEGTDVILTMLRDGQEMEFTVTRATIEVEFCSYKMLDNNIGYILVSEFEETTGLQFEAAIDDLTEQGMEALIVDIRSNPGGLLNIVCDMLDRILPKDSLLVYTEDKRGQKVYTYAETKKTIDLPMAVLVNGNSASASEIFSGALQDYGKAAIIGTQTFGKGIVQSVIPISQDISGIKLTSSRYFTPNGVCIHGLGITPDIIVELEEGLEKQLIEQRDHDNQIDAAVEYLLEEMNK